MADSGIAYEKALALLKRAATPFGILASVDARDNYRRVWARDGVIAGLAGLLAGDDNIRQSFKSTLLLLSENRGPQGQIASNIALDEKGKVRSISYGGLAGRVDAIPWFIIGVCQYRVLCDDAEIFERCASAIRAGLALLKSWEYNNRGLVYVPQAGDWADEYVLHGYVFYDQVLRLWATKLYARLSNDAEAAKQARTIQQLIEINFWPEPGAEQPFYHPGAAERLLAGKGKLAYPPAALSPGGYFPQFDGLGSALALLAGLFTPAKRRSLINYMLSLTSEVNSAMIPAFWPAINKGDSPWPMLAGNYAFEFKNQPGHYHNGGLWPMVNGWWGAALAKHGLHEEAGRVLEAVNGFNKKKNWGFYEYGAAFDHSPNGTPYMAWSAAATLLLQNILNGKKLVMD